MNNFIRFSLGQKVLLNLVFVLLIVIGAFVLLIMPVERYPNIHFGKVFVITYFPGASPSDVESLVTKKIEDALEDLADVEYIQSHSYRQRSSVLVKFEDDSDYRALYDDLRLKVLAIVSDLPPAAEQPTFNFLDVNDWFPTIGVNIYGNQSNKTLTTIAEELKIPLSQVKGVKELKLRGEYVQEFHVILDKDKLRRLGVTYDQAAQALQQANISIPAGDYTTGSGEFIIKVDERFRQIEEVLDCIVRVDGDGAFVRIRDIVDRAFHTYRDPFITASVNGQDCVTLEIIKKSSGNALFITDDVKKIISELAPHYQKEDVNLVITQDSTLKIKDSIRVLGVNLIIGITLVCLIIWRFMGLRNAAITTIGIPFAFLVTMVFMYFTGNSINEVSLFAFILVSGIIVDDAIVVVENIYRHLQAGKPVRESVIDGTAEVFLPVVAATLTTIAAFMPMLIMTGSVGDFFALIPKTITFALCASLLECLLILPCHYLDFGPAVTTTNTATPENPDAIDSLCPWELEEGPVMTGIRTGFNRLLLLVLRYRFSSLLLLLLGFFGAIFIFASSHYGKTNLIRIQFFPDDYSRYYVELTGPTGTPLETTNHLVKKISKYIMAAGKEKAESANGFGGMLIDEDYIPFYGNHLGHVVVTLPAGNIRHFDDFPENDVEAHLASMREHLRPLIDNGFTMRIRPERDGPPAGKDINIRILGVDEENVAGLAKRIEHFLKNEKNLSQYLSNLQDDQGKAGRVFHIKINKQRVAEYGLTVAQAAGLAASVINGRVVGKYKTSDEEIDIKLKVAIDQRQLTDALDVPVLDHLEGTIRLRDLCTVEYNLEPGFLNHFRGRRAITLTADLATGAPVSGQSVVQKTREFYATIMDDYPGAGLNFAGEHESTKKSYSSLTYAFLISILIIYVILATQFQSYAQPLIILSAVIFGITGVIYGTFFSRTLFTINSFVAIVGVTGVVVNDSLVLVEFINKCYRKGLNRRQALIRGTNIRLRPILLTTLTTTLGLLPMALGIPEYSITWGTMAMTFVTGLCTATFLTIIIVPVEWDILTRRKESIEQKKSYDNKTISI